MNQEERIVHDRIVLRVAMGFESLEDVVEIAHELAMVEGFAVPEAWIRARVEEAWSAQEAASQAWARPTDPQKLALAFDRLWSDHRILGLHRAGYTTTDAESEVVEQHHALHARGLAPEGYCFYHEQDLERALDPTSLTLLVGYQKVDNEDPEVTRDIGVRVADALNEQGLEVAWDGDVSRRIALEGVRWHKRFGEDAAAYRHDRYLHG